MRNLPLSLYVRAGEIISARTWNTLVTFMRGCRLLSGRGTRVDCRPDGTTVTFDGRANAWLHDFKCTLRSDYSGAKVRFGLVGGKPPTIDGAALDETDENTLTWDTTRLDVTRRGWIAVEATFDKNWGVESSTLVQVADLDTASGDAPKTAVGDSPTGFAGASGTLTLPGRRARWPLAMLRKREAGNIVLFQITRYSLGVRSSIPIGKDGKPADSGRHFFYAMP